MKCGLGGGGGYVRVAIVGIGHEQGSRLKLKSVLSQVFPATVKSWPYDLLGTIVMAGLVSPTSRDRTGCRMPSGLSCKQVHNKISCNCGSRKVDLVRNMVSDFLLPQSGSC